MAEELHVELRETRGKRRTRRLRNAGSIPAVLYGHGQETISLSVPAGRLETAVRHGSRLVMLTGAVTEQAFVRDLQWDTWGTHVLHVDFTRISEHEKVEVEVQVELRGEAPGVREGGVVEQLLHQVELECEASSIPDKLHVNINLLKLGDTITVAELEIPENATVLRDPEQVVVQCVEPVVEPEEEIAGAEEAEPEVIGRKPEDEEGKS